MNDDQERVLRTWLEARDPGGSPARLRAIVEQVPYNARRARLAALDAVLTRGFGPTSIVRLAVLLVILLAFVLAVVGTALVLRSNPFPPRGLIAYVVPRGPLGVPGIRLIAADGSGDRPVSLTNDNLADYAPRWSPDGLKLVFVRVLDSDPSRSCSGEEGSIVLYDPPTSTERVIATDLRLLHAAEWSPSGSQIGFLQDAADCETLELGVIDVETGRVTTSNVGGAAGASIVPGGGRAIRKGLSWTGTSFQLVDPLLGEVPSSAGRLVAVAPLVRDIKSRLEIVDLETGNRINLGPGSWPAWSPDDRSVAFVQPTEDVAEFGVQFHDRLAVALVETGAVLILGEVLVPSVGGTEDATPPLFWTHDGRAIYWLDKKGGHVVDVASGRTFDLPTALLGCPDLQWQPIPSN